MRPDTCAARKGTGVDLDTSELDGVCHSCHGTGATGCQLRGPAGPDAVRRDQR
jgi:hypothetical protein